MNRSFWNGKRVFITGHTGFKGSWLSLMLADCGAEVHGFALAPSTTPSIFVSANVPSVLAGSILGDIRDFTVLKAAIDQTNPEIVFHLAAQPLVRYSYKQPLETYSVNAMGTAHVLQASLENESVKALVNVTTDKCYENKEWVWPYRENEPLGGFDPYSSSKACSEIITAAYRQSFYQGVGRGLASARAGNVIGGGDWSEDRLIPDFLRAIDRNETLLIRSPNATRPWQHVLEPLAGYLALAESVYSQPLVFDQAFNFGPEESDVKSVEWIVRRLCEQIKGSTYRVEPATLHEAQCLKLDSSKAKSLLEWRPKLNLAQALDLTLEWHHAWREGKNMQEVTIEQARRYDQL